MQLFGNRFGNKQNSDEEEIRVEKPTTTHIPPPSLTPRQTIGFDTVLGPGSALEGDLISRGNIRLDGTFTGTLDITGNVLVGETAEIKADIDAGNISIAGQVRGNVTGSKVQLLRTAKVWGDIRATAFSSEEGAFIDGKISMEASVTTTETDIVTEAVAETKTQHQTEGASTEKDDELDGPTIIVDDTEPITETEQSTDDD